MALDSEPDKNRQATKGGRPFLRFGLLAASSGCWADVHGLGLTGLAGFRAEECRMQN